ncbi:hypothetical protein COV61_03410 [Candidatus Micrarchaeota archaeon CG11_big_fil_rev_8_21_14_0_20_47_5]|nr:MAG: hypothetical protein AUJ17_00910 [Candidatus Micrarchaeota archaeon CG1_02_47_40]PIN83330.1 MAG: hypothetical protein COV61_03410 [Candidatus Micrarchaeota archaeon CG11_big_fil_rev_8_21_14_0_20_47_5]
MGQEIEIAAVIISVFALIISITKDFIMPAIFKPKLILNAENDEECVHEASWYPQKKVKLKETFEFNPKFGKKQRWLRFRLNNRQGFFSRTAENCYVKMLEIRNSKNQPVQPFNMIYLGLFSPAVWKNNLAKGEYQMINLVYETQKERVLNLVPVGPLGLPLSLLERKNEKLCPDVYTLKIGVYGDNFEPTFKEFKVELTKKFGELKFVE